jgi:hypothetical protein
MYRVRVLKWVKTTQHILNRKLEVLKLKLWNEIGNADRMHELDEKIREEEYCYG